jgi:hypothetical protein
MQLMSDRVIEPGQEWPRHYTPAEIEQIAESLVGVELAPWAVVELQDEATGYQWAMEADDGLLLSYTNKERRDQLNLILEFLKNGVPKEIIRAALDELDGPTLQRLARVPITDRLKDRQRLARRIRKVIAKIPASGPDPKRARRQFIVDLANIYQRVTGKRPGRLVDGGEGGDFRKFVIAALTPFGSAGGCEEDMKAALKAWKSKSP